MVHPRGMFRQSALVFGLASACLAAVLLAEDGTIDPRAAIEALKKEEMDAAQRMVKEIPRSAAAMNLLGMVYNTRGNSAEAIRCWQRCLELNPNQVDAYDAMAWTALLKGEHEQAIALWGKALSIRPQTPGVRVRLARALINRGRPQEAAAALENELQLSSTSEAYVLLGQAYLQMKDYLRAQKSYEAAVAIDAETPEAHYGLATVFARLGERTKAAESMQRFRRLKTDDLDTRIQRINESDDLVAVRRSAAQTLTDVGRAYGHYGFLLKAESCWRRAAELDAKNTPCRLELATLCQGQGHIEEALTWCEQLRRIEPNHAMHWLRIGTLQQRLDRHQAAAEAYRQVIKLAPERPEGYGAMVRLALSTKGDLGEAKPLVDKLIQLAPTAVHYALLSEVFRQSGDRAGALAGIAEALKREPENAAYQQTRQELEKQP